MKRPATSSGSSEEAFAELPPEDELVLPTANMGSGNDVAVVGDNSLMMYPATFGDPLALRSRLSETEYFHYVWQGPG